MHQRDPQTRHEPRRERSTPRQNKTWHPKAPFVARARIRELLRSRTTWTWLSVLLLAVLPHTATAQLDTTTAEVTPARMQTGSLLLRMKSGYVVATRMNTDIDAQVSGLVARVSISQSFRNDGQDWVEGIYVFPLPDTAAVDRLRMRIGERIIEGEIREKEQAKKEYEAAKSAGKKTSLVEQQRANLFITSVANIGPGEAITIQIEYLETIKYDEGSFSLRFPLTLTPRHHRHRRPDPPVRHAAARAQGKRLGTGYNECAGRVINNTAGSNEITGSQSQVHGDHRRRRTA